MTGNTIWVLQVGCYEQEYIQGVYASPEAAISDCPIPSNIPQRYFLRTDGWKQRDDGSWGNGLDYDYAANITPFEIQETTEESSK